MTAPTPTSQTRQTIKPRQWTIDVLPRQMDFIAATERELLYSGAFGAGKTRALCVKLVHRAATPGAREGLCRKAMVQLRATTLRTLLEADGDLPPVLPPGTYTHHKSEKTIQIRGGGAIVYFGLDAPEKIGSYNLTGCAVDEAVEVTEDDWTQLRGRIRLTAGELPRQIYGACNPDTPSHFLAKRFGLALGAQPAPDCRAILTRSRDNWFLPGDYLANLASLGSLRRKRYYEGRWVGSDNQVYTDWHRPTFVKQRTGPWRRVVVGIDVGFTNPTVLLAIAIDEDDRLHVLEEWYRPRQLEANIITHANTLADRYPQLECMLIDPSAPRLSESLLMHGLNVKAAKNDVLAGINAVRSRLVVAGDGRPRLTVDPSCTELIREFETYELDPASDRPIKANDHAMDALRYAVNHIDKPKREPEVRLFE